MPERKPLLSKQPKDFSAAFKQDSSGMMCKACSVPTAKKLPATWLNMAGRLSSQKFMSIIQNAFQRESSLANVLALIPNA